MAKFTTTIRYADWVGFEDAFADTMEEAKGIAPSGFDPIGYQTTPDPSRGQIEHSVTFSDGDDD